MKNLDAKLNLVDKAAFFFFAVMIFFLPTSNAAVEVSLGFIFICFIVKSYLTKATLKDFLKFFKERINLSLLLFFLLIGLSLFFSGPLIEKSLRAWIGKWGQCVLLFFLAQALLKKSDIRKLLYVLAFSAFLICVDGIYQRLFGVDFMRGFEGVSKNNFYAIRATFNSYNDFACFLITTFFICLSLALTTSNQLLKRSLIFLNLLIITNLILTFSRGGWVSFLIVLLVAPFLISKKEKKGKYILIFLSLLFFLLLIPFTRERFLFIFAKGGDADRFRIWDATFAMFKDSPILGNGLGLFMDKVRNYKNVIPQYAHNCYFQMLAETGLVGFLAFFWFLAELADKTVKAMSKKTDAMLFGLFLSLLAFLTHSFFDTHLYSLRLALFFWMIASFTVILTSENSRNNQ